MFSSPCVGICQLDAAGSTCTGCFRTIEEITNWTKLTDEEREEITARALHLVFDNFPPERT